MRTQDTESEGKWGLQEKNVVNDPVVAIRKDKASAHPLTLHQDSSRTKNSLENVLGSFVGKWSSCTDLQKLTVRRKQPLLLLLCGQGTGASHLHKTAKAAHVAV